MFVGCWPPTYVVILGTEGRALQRCLGIASTWGARGVAFCSTRDDVSGLSRLMSSAAAAPADPPPKATRTADLFGGAVPPRNSQATAPLWRWSNQRPQFSGPPLGVPANPGLIHCGALWLLAQPQQFKLQI